MFVCAAIWDHWTGLDDDLETVSVLTMPANELVMPCDDRMPVILDAEHFAAWLDPREKDPAKLLTRFKVYPADQMVAAGRSARESIHPPKTTRT